MCCPRTPQLPTPPCPHRHPRRLTCIEHPLTTFRVYRGGRSSRHRQWVRIIAVRAFRRRCLWDRSSCAIGPPSTRSHSCLQLHGAQTRSSRTAAANTLATVRVCARPVSPVTTHPEPSSVSFPQSFQNSSLAHHLTRCSLNCRKTPPPWVRSPLPSCFPNSN
jgi:hypothetical protein